MDDVQYILNISDYELKRVTIQPFNYTMLIGSDYIACSQYVYDFYEKNGKEAMVADMMDDEDLNNPPKGAFTSCYNHYVMFIPKDASLMTIIHECLHAALTINEDVGINFLEENQEAITYLQEHIISLVLQAMGRPSIDDKTPFEGMK